MFHPVVLNSTTTAARGVVAALQAVPLFWRIVHTIRVEGVYQVVWGCSSC